MALTRTFSTLVLGTHLLPWRIAALSVSHSELYKTHPDAVSRASKVFCNGTLLDTVQRSGLFQDSKTFVDMSLLEDPEVVLAAFEKLEKPEDPTVLQSFLDKYFKSPGHELKPWSPPDFNKMPPRFQVITNSSLLAWASELNKLWFTLGRAQDEAIAQTPQRHTSIARRHGMVIPGGRFRETYYWDTYWIVLGLLICDMKDTARGVVENLLDDVRYFGFVPNGGRIYYLDRSQPPLLTDMVLAVYDAAPDKNWLESVLPVLEKEYEFWMDPTGGHLVTIPEEFAGDDTFVLNVFHSTSATPRPESYIEDVETAAKAKQDLGRKQSEVYHALRSAAESGWDFSSRWLAAGTGGPADLETINTSAVVPVDLNSVLYKMELGLARIKREIKCGNLRSEIKSETSAYYQNAAAKRARAMKALLWVESEGSFRDFRLDAGAPSAVISLSDYAAPSWAGLSCITPPMKQAMLASLKSSGLLQAGGGSTTTLFSGQQWDAPNAWAPIELMLVQGLDQFGRDSEEAAELANSLATAWLDSNYEAWHNTGVMYEKYNAYKPGTGGGGGEYEPQVGFGWSNGVALVLLEREFSGSAQVAFRRNKGPANSVAFLGRLERKLNWKVVDLNTIKMIFM